MYVSQSGDIGEWADVTVTAAVWIFTVKSRF